MVLFQVSVFFFHNVFFYLDFQRFYNIFTYSKYTYSFFKIAMPFCEVLKIAIPFCEVLKVLMVLIILCLMTLTPC